MSRGGVQKGEGDGEWAGRGGDYKGGTPAVRDPKYTDGGTPDPTRGVSVPLAEGRPYMILWVFKGLILGQFNPQTYPGTFYSGG